MVAPDMADWLGSSDRLKPSMDTTTPWIKRQQQPDLVENLPVSPMIAGTAHWGSFGSVFHKWVSGHGSQDRDGTRPQSQALLQLPQMASLLMSLDHARVPPFVGPVSPASTESLIGHTLEDLLCSPMYPGISQVHFMVQTHRTLT